MACHGLSFRYSLRDGGNIFRGVGYSPALMGYMIPSGYCTWRWVRWLECADWRAAHRAERKGATGQLPLTGPIVGTGQKADSFVWVLLAGSILCCSGHHLESGCKR